MNSYLRYRGIQYKSVRHPTNDTKASDSALQPAPNAASSQACVILRYRGALYIRGNFDSSQLSELRFLSIPAAVSKLT